MEAGPSSAGYRLRKLARRYRNALATAAAFVLLLALAAAASTWQAVRATRAERHGPTRWAVAAEKRAQTEHANARAALDFLWKDVLSQASYRNEPDRDLTVRTLLDRVADRLGRGPPNRRWWRPRSVKWSGASISIKGSIARRSRIWKRPWRYSAATRRGRPADPGHHAPPRSLPLSPGPREATGVLARTLELRRRVLGNDHDDTLFTADSPPSATRSRAAAMRPSDC